MRGDELDDRTGLHYTWVGGIKCGERNPALVNMGRIAAALDVSLAELFPADRGGHRRLRLLVP